MSLSNKKVKFETNTFITDIFEKINKLESNCKTTEDLEILKINLTTILDLNGDIYESISNITELEEEVLKLKEEIEKKDEDIEGLKSLVNDKDIKDLIENDGDITKKIENTFRNELSSFLKDQQNINGILVTNFQNNQDLLKENFKNAVDESIDNKITLNEEFLSYKINEAYNNGVKSIEDKHLKEVAIERKKAENEGIKKGKKEISNLNFLDKLIFLFPILKVLKNKENKNV